MLPSADGSLLWTMAEFQSSGYTYSSMTWPTFPLIWGTKVHFYTTAVYAMPFWDRTLCMCIPRSAVHCKSGPGLHRVARWWPGQTARTQRVAEFQENSLGIPPQVEIFPFLGTQNNFLNYDFGQTVSCVILSTEHDRTSEFKRCDCPYLFPPSPKLIICLWALRSLLPIMQSCLFHFLAATKSVVKAFMICVNLIWA